MYARWMPMLSTTSGLEGNGRPSCYKEINKYRKTTRTWRNCHSFELDRAEMTAWQGSLSHRLQGTHVLVHSIYQLYLLPPETHSATGCCQVWVRHPDHHRDLLATQRALLPQLLLQLPTGCL